MKHTLLIFLISILGSQYCFSQGLHEFYLGDEVYIFAVSGLNMRSSASLDASIVAKVSYGSKMVVLEASDFKSIKIGNRLGVWLKCRSAENEVGYLYSAYLSKINPPVLSAGNREVYIDDVKYDHLQKWLINQIIQSGDSLVASGSKRIKFDVDPDKGIGGVMWKLYSDGTYIAENYSYENMDIEIHTFKINTNDMLNFIELYLSYLVGEYEKRNWQYPQPEIKYPRTDNYTYGYNSISVGYPFIFSYETNGYRAIISFNSFSI